jgi:hypothetical protein
MLCYAIPPDAVRVEPPVAWLTRARVVGIARANYVFDNDLKNYGDPKPQSEQMANHIRAARTERALEHYTGLPWHEAIGVLGGPDLGDRVQVRSKFYPPGGDLAFRPGLDWRGRQLDRDDHAFMLVWDAEEYFLIIGWLWGRECRAADAKLHPGGYKYIGPPYRTPGSLLLGLKATPEILSSATTATAMSWDQQTPDADF